MKTKEEQQQLSPTGVSDGMPGTMPIITKDSQAKTISIKGMSSIPTLFLSALAEGIESLLPAQASQAVEVTKEAIMTQQDIQSKLSTITETLNTSFKGEVSVEDLRSFLASAIESGGITTETFEVLLESKTPEQQAYSIAMFFFLQSNEVLKVELSSIFNEPNLLNILNAYKSDIEVFAPALELYAVNIKEILMYAAQNTELLCVIKTLCKAGVDINQVIDSSSNTRLIHIAAESNNLEAIRFCHENDKDSINKAAIDNVLPIHFAAQCGNLEAIRFCHENGDKDNINKVSLGNVKVQKLGSGISDNELMKE